MKRSIALAALALASVPLAACVDDGYNYGVGVGWRSYPYDVWYDGYYGPFYDGYWGTDGFFYYRQFEHDRHYRRANRGHFRRDGDHFYRDRPTVPDPRFRRYDGRTRQPPQGTRMPRYPRDDRDRDRR